jgi:hypothetical protein
VSLSVSETTRKYETSDIASQEIRKAGTFEEKKTAYRLKRKSP